MDKCSSDHFEILNRLVLDVIDTKMKMKIILMIMLLLSCSERRLQIPFDSEVKSVRSEPPKSHHATLNLNGEFLVEGNKLKPDELSKVLKSCYERAGESFTIILTIDKNHKTKDLNKIFRIAAKENIKNFSIVVEDKNKFQNYRHFQIMSELSYKKHNVEEGEVFFTDSSQTIQEIINSISSKKKELPNYVYYSYYIVY